MNLSKHSTTSSTKLRLVEEAANRKALEAKLELLGENKSFSQKTTQATEIKRRREYTPTAGRRAFDSNILIG